MCGVVIQWMASYMLSSTYQDARSAKFSTYEKRLNGFYVEVKLCFVHRQGIGFFAVLYFLRFNLRYV